MRAIRRLEMGASSALPISFSAPRFSGDGKLVILSRQRTLRHVGTRLGDKICGYILLSLYFISHPQPIRTSIRCPLVSPYAQWRGRVEHTAHFGTAWTHAPFFNWGLGSPDEEREHDLTSFRRRNDSCHISLRARISGLIVLQRKRYNFTASLRLPDRWFLLIVE